MQEEEKDWLTWAKSLGTGYFPPCRLFRFQWFLAACSSPQRLMIPGDKKREPSSWSFEKDRCPKTWMSPEVQKWRGSLQESRVLRENHWFLPQPCYFCGFSVLFNDTNQGIAGTKLNLSLREVDQETGEDCRPENGQILTIISWNQLRPTDQCCQFAVHRCW